MLLPTLSPGYEGIAGDRSATKMSLCISGIEAPWDPGFQHLEIHVAGSVIAKTLTAAEFASSFGKWQAIRRRGTVLGL